MEKKLFYCYGKDDISDQNSQCSQQELTCSVVLENVKELVREPMSGNALK